MQGHYWDKTTFVGEEHARGMKAYDRTMAHVEDMLRTAKPDIVVFDGDICDERGRTEWNQLMECWTQLISYVEKYGVLWTFVPGNHENDVKEEYWERCKLIEIYAAYPKYCLSVGQKSFNHVLNIVKGTILMAMFDSHGDKPANKDGLKDEVEPAVVAAFDKYMDDHFDCTKTENATAPGKQVEKDALRLAFLHIPLRQFPPTVENNEGKLLSGILSKARKLNGVDTGLYEKLQKHQFDGVFCGNDHHSDACMVRGDEKTTANIWLCYNRVGAFTPPSEWEGKVHLPFAGR
ncbi:unnamed protein product [Vitrella brassicaformis CCMP3155]|uniref:Calcineurin-like phosphoesterase domain-containing protein n=1 Tax=Vitrella brassicaformis (strain CCMP3155) TaxID=1169540 RepID=A0A0G4ESM4_VITBC|nr:unnamed protein product [Vitrella brassicaformis CCMP3155]|mmetsp:Transcript_13308/g.31747  ORF Transcript_13308/g.31747 Transcript_13308/m.31747 type:complete len:291 (+) Transcript_13308:345-1217(+)|eukprot:CEM00870.1 unnamed protein product [Vitrella brassicaformis CCMP3155]